SEGDQNCLVWSAPQSLFERGLFQNPDSNNTGGLPRLNAPQEDRVEAAKLHSSPHRPEQFSRECDRFVQHRDRREHSQSSNMRGRICCPSGSLPPVSRLSLSKVP